MDVFTIKIFISFRPKITAVSGFTDVDHIGISAAKKTHKMEGIVVHKVKIELFLLYDE